MKQHDYQHLVQFFKQEINPRVSDVIFTYKNNKYRIFNKFVVSINDGLVTLTDNNDPAFRKVFSSLKHAVTWCTYKDVLASYESSRVLALDTKLASIENSLELYNKFLKKPDLSFDLRDVYRMKISEMIFQKKVVRHELKILVLKAKRIQTSRFDKKMKRR